MKNVIKMLIVLSSIGVISGGVLSQVSSWANPFIEINRKKETERAIFIVQPEAKSYAAVEQVDFEMYKALDGNNKLLGYALPFEGNGFQGKIRIMIGLSKELDKIISIETLEQVETPGLGTKITEEDFKNQFKNLSTIPKVEWVKGVPPAKENQIQAITGATISSKSVVEIINAGLDKARKDLSTGEVK